MPSPAIIEALLVHCRRRVRFGAVTASMWRGAVQFPRMLSARATVSMRGPRTPGRIPRCDQAALVGTPGRIRSFTHRMTAWSERTIPSFSPHLDRFNRQPPCSACFAILWALFGSTPFSGASQIWTLNRWRSIPGRLESSCMRSSAVFCALPLVAKMRSTSHLLAKPTVSPKAGRLCEPFRRPFSGDIRWQWPGSGRSEP